MPRKRITVTAWSIQNPRAGRRYGQLAQLPLQFQSKTVLLRVPVNGIPDGATITSAVINFGQRGDTTGTRHLRLQNITSGWNSGVTWNTRPDAGTEVDVTVTKGPGQGGRNWGFDVTQAIQDRVDGVEPNRGFQLSTTDPWVMRVQGSSADWNPPYMDVVYTLLPDAPDNLHPADAAVSSSHPVLTFDADDDITALQVQIDPAMNGVAPEFDSGTVASSGGLLDLSETTYAGLATGAATAWRARQQTGAGWSPWSEWVEFSRVAKELLTITSPVDGAIAEGTPPIVWDFGGTQTAWQVRYLTDEGDVLDDTGYTPGDATDYTPSRGLRRDGDEGLIEVNVWGDSERVATPGDPEYVTATLPVTLTLSAVVAPVDTLTATSDGVTPEVVLTGERAAGIPDEMVVFVDDVQVATYPGVDVFTGTSYTITDITPIVNREVTYRVAPKVNGEIASGGPEATIWPEVTGVWLTDIDTGDRVVIYGEGRGSVPSKTRPESAVLHRPLSGGAPQVVRRRLQRSLPEGSITGVVQDPAGPEAALLPSADVCEQLLDQWAADDAGHKFWLVYAGFAGQVIIGDYNPGERDNPNHRTRRQFDVSLNYWGQR